MTLTLTVKDMTTPQLSSAAPVQLCPKCGRRMQILSVSDTTYSYICTAHSLQNSDSADPYYLNIHFKFVESDGRIKEMKGRDDPRFARRSG